MTAIRDLVESHLLTARMNDCGLAAQAGINGPPLTWTYTAAGGGCAAPLILTIDRSYSFPTAVNGYTFNVISTHVTLQYPYRWQFNKVIGFLAAGATYPGISQLKTEAVVPNME